jgi:hypothetical protein
VGHLGWRALRGQEYVGSERVKRGLAMKNGSIGVSKGRVFCREWSNFEIESCNWGRSSGGPPCLGGLEDR